nr:hypothetical protein [Tanacetum cinerariifolium]
MISTSTEEEEDNDDLLLGVKGTPMIDPFVTWWIALTKRFNPMQRVKGGWCCVVGGYGDDEDDDDDVMFDMDESGDDEDEDVQFKRTSLTGFPAQSIRSSNVIALDSPYLLVLITGTSQSRQHASRFKNQESSIIKKKSPVNSDKQDLPSRNPVYQGRLLASFQDDTKYQHGGQDTRLQGGKDDQDKRIKI